MSIIPLRSMAINQSGIIKSVRASGELGRRIRDMGLVPGTPVTVIGRAPLNDPVALRLRDFTMTLRNKEADFILVDVDASADETADQAEEAAQAREPAVRSSEAELLAFLKEKKLNVTQQRLDIANLFLALPGHHTLEEIYATVKREAPTVGQSTVYRTILLLCDAGLAREVLLEDGRSCYESVLGRSHHDHLICQKCGRIVEFVNVDIETLQERIARENGFELSGHHLLLYGLCAACRLANGSKA